MSNMVLVRVLMVVVLVAAHLQPIKSQACPPNVCEQENCISDNFCADGYTLMPTFCGCCQKCVPVVAQGGQCSADIMSPAINVCAPGTQCCQGTCQESCFFNAK